MGRGRRDEGGGPSILASNPHHYRHQHLAFSPQLPALRASFHLATAINMVRCTIALITNPKATIFGLTTLPTTAILRIPRHANRSIVIWTANYQLTQFMITATTIITISRLPTCCANNMDRLFMFIGDCFAMYLWHRLRTQCRIIS